ncbi:DgyrCDS2832 [Dimorphilus gyrociliatus]|uniref:DgyrCDS2832 n=1 Tax=Dimorphilus gyrociliatus TaxID=2664684 RepID=A0A7I8VCP1_9ANNE|nr:DgyrCDS2832 [Dimorphilus gyrociliatus]
MGRRRKAHKDNVKARKLKANIKTDIPNKEIITEDILKKRRTNPHAKVSLSGKKKRRILKRLKHSKTGSNPTNDEEMMEVKPQEKTTKKTPTKKKQTKNVEIGPGPAAYLLPSTFAYDCHDVTKKRAPAISIAGKIKTKEEIGCGPGPGKVMIAKFLTNTGVNKGPEISIKGRNFFQSLKRDADPKLRNIGPSDSKLYRSQPAFTIQSKNYPKVKNEDSPAPNRYCISSTLGKGPSFSLSGRWKAKTLKSNDCPRYQLGHKTKLDAPAFSIQSRHEPPTYSSVIPGPMYKINYDSILPSVHGSYFGCRHRDGVGTMRCPSPSSDS